MSRIAYIEFCAFFREVIMVVALNIGRWLMVGLALYSLALIFFPQALNHAPNPKAAAIQFAIAYAIGWGLDRCLGWVRRRKAEAAEAA